MKTIKETLFNRLAAQAAEADLQGLEATAVSLTHQLRKQAQNLRSTEEGYTYPKEDFEQDVNDTLWEAVLRILDFYDIQSFDAERLQDVVENLREQLVQEVCNDAGVDHGVGAFEPNVPGEERRTTVLEIEE